MNLGFRHATRWTIGSRFQDYAAGLTRRERGVGRDPSVCRHDVDVTGDPFFGCNAQAQGHILAFEEHATANHLDRRVLAAVIEDRPHFCLEAHLASDDADQSHQAMLVRGRLARDRHKVDDLADTLGTEEARYQDRRAGQVHLSRDGAIARRTNAEEAAVLMVQQRAEDARRVEARQTQPVDGALRTDEGCGLEVADESVVFDGWVVVFVHGTSILGWQFPTEAVGCTQHLAPERCA